MTLLSWLVLALALVTFISFCWAIKRFFVAEGPPQAGMRSISIGGLACTAAHLATLAWLEPAQGVWAVAGAALYGAALLVFFAAVRTTSIEPPTLAFTGDEPTQLYTDGPYRYVRHPFYAAYLLAWIAGTVASAEPALGVTVVGMGALYVMAARYEELKFARSRLGPAYLAYRSRTGFLLPWLGRDSGSTSLYPPRRSIAGSAEDEHTMGMDGGAVVHRGRRL